MSPPHKRSLFWTIVGIFLLTAIIGTLLQALVASAVLHPLEVREAKARAELAATAVASAFASAPRMLTAVEIDTLLARHRPSVRPAVILFRASDGTVQSSPPGRFLGRAFPDSAGTDSSRSASAPPGPGGGDRGRLETLARRDVVRGTRPVGEVLVVRRMRARGAMGLLEEPREALFLFPVAIAASAFAGLVLMRLLVRRLRAMEVLASRVAEGDLSVRIADKSGDEIGRLAEQLDRMTERLSAARSELHETELQRRQLFADITHELATPLTSIRGYAETLLDPGVPVSPEERTRYVRGLLDESRRMDLLIRDLFELARLEAGAAPLQKERLDWAALCRNTIERFQPRFRKAGLTLLWNERGAEAWIEADGRRMEQVLENLLVNALRYVHAGGHVDVTLDTPPRPGTLHRLVVSDDGPGIPPEEISLVFGRFYRGSASSSGTGSDEGQGGSGLGLSIVREIVERHDGTATAKTSPSGGLAIQVEIPTAPY